MYYTRQRISLKTDFPKILSVAIIAFFYLTGTAQSFSSPDRITQWSTRPASPVEISRLLENPFVSGQKVKPQAPKATKTKLSFGQEKTRETDSIKGKISEGDSIYEILQEKGLSNGEIYQLTEAIKRVHNISRIPNGAPFKMDFENGVLKTFCYEINKENTVLAIKKGNSFLAKIEPINFEVKTVLKGTRIRNNLYSTVLSMGERPGIILDIAEIFSWDFGFIKDLKEADQLKIVIEKKYRNGNFVKNGRLLGAQFIKNGKKITAIYFPRAGSYYTPEGKSLKKQFLKAPLKYSRITSVFSEKRFHPILKKYIPHRSVDYAAPMGTQVYAVADGRITFSGTSGPSGKLIRIKHNRTYSTAYCHLGVFAKGIRNGVYVKKGQVIGSVGMTGRTTGPHLCFHLKKNGVPIDPLNFKGPNSKPVPKSQWEAFVQVRKDIMSKLTSPLGRG